MHSRFFALLLLLTSVASLAAQGIMDRNSLLPDDLQDAGDSVVQPVSESLMQVIVDAPSVAAGQSNDSEADAAAIADSIANAALSSYIHRSVYRSWRRSHPAGRLSRNVRVQMPQISFMADSLWGVVNALPVDHNHQDMLFLYDMRLPIINSGYVPVDSMAHYYEHTQQMEEAEESDLLPVEHFDRQYENQRLNEEMRHLVRYRYASADPRRFRYVRRSFDVPTSEGHTLDTKTTVQQTRIADDLDIDFGKADLESFGQYFELKADKWHWKGDHTLTLQQTAQSINWYKGGDNNMSVSGNQKITVNRYDEDAKTTFEAVLDLKLSGYYTKADTVHSMKVSDNELSLTFKYGYKAWKKWYYSAQLYSKTPVFDYYKPNSAECKSTFLSPLELNLSLGVDYQYISPNKKFSYSLLLAPLSYDLKAVRDDRVKVTDYGIPEGDATLHKFGSSITTKFEWKIGDNASWSSRLYYFTPYNSVQVEFENTFNFKISRFFTARVYAYPRFDDSRDTETEIKEMLTIGFSYQW